MLRLVTLITVAAIASPALAEWTPVPGRVLKDMVAGSTVVIDAPMGFKLPIRHAEDGTMSGSAGGLSFYLGASTDTGRWWIERERLCYKWARWFKSETRCMKVRQDGGNRIQWEKEDGETGTATVTVAALPKPAPPVSIARMQPAAATQPPAAARAQPSTPARVAVPSPRVASPQAPAATAKAKAAAPAPKAVAPLPSSPAPSVAKAQASAAAAAAKPQPKPPAPAAAAIPNTRVAAAPSPPYRIGGPPPPAYRVVSVAFDDVLNVRGGPSTEHMPVAALGPDTTDVRILGPCRSEWCFVRHGDIVGWVNTYYLEEMTSRR